MDTDEFIKLQYESLRKEIASAQEYIVKAITGSTVLLSLLGVADKLLEPQNQMLSDFLAVFLLVTPFLMLSITQLLYTNIKTIHRAGTYIREQIEPQIKIENSEFIAWENWLFAPQNKYWQKHIDQKIPLMAIQRINFYLSCVLAAFSLWNIISKPDKPIFIIENDWFILKSILVTLALLFAIAYGHMLFAELDKDSNEKIRQG